MASESILDQGDDVEIVNVRRRQARSLATRRKILDAALEEFSASGFDGSTTRSIATRAGVRHGLVIYHFETKQGVWDAVMEQAFSDWHDDVSSRTKELRHCDPVTTLREIYRHFTLMTAAKPALLWLSLHESGMESDRFAELHEKYGAEDVADTMHLIREAQRQGRYVKGDPAHLHFLYMGASTRIFLEQKQVEKFTGQSVFDAEFLERHIEMCASLFFRDPPAE
ncbi:TetR/AcrR family transcriptional regulator [Croceicoccus bisphenolivorans]|uniref:TetR/AcrR family transcriptional regulator n=1 Tax=Croceicoccus bisphenolivorans TaxID=1783232 RepID=UPI000A5FA80A|nr:TetR/AcrR family transcriptional regulator [Croceicoccus bisphenolivorans]